MLVIFFYWKHGNNWRTWFFHKDTNVVTTTNIDMVISIIIVTDVDIIYYMLHVNSILASFGHCMWSTWRIYGII